MYLSTEEVLQARVGSHSSQQCYAVLNSGACTAVAMGAPVKQDECTLLNNLNAKIVFYDTTHFFFQMPDKLC